MVKQKSNLLIETLEVKTALNSYKNILQQISLNIRSLDKQDWVAIKEWSTKKLTAKQVQHKGIESSFHIIKTVLPHITLKEISKQYKIKLYNIMNMKWLYFTSKQYIKS